MSTAPDDRFYYDAEAAARIIRFFQRYLIHSEGRHAGNPFTLHPAQRELLGSLFGWKRKADGMRRYSDCYFESAVGAGKSPLLAGIGLYLLMADGEQAAQVYSIAGSFGQARVVFESAKRFARANAALSRELVIVERAIRHPASGSVWEIVSGKGPGAGCRPSAILGDEAHQWRGPGAYTDLRDRMFKRAQPLCIVATNAPTSEASFCWRLREQAIAAADGTGDETLLPIIWRADDDDATDDPAAWAKANPLIGTTITVDSVARAAASATRDPAAEADFRRLYLGIVPKGKADRWLDLAVWDERTSDEPPPADAKLYVGLDMSLSDDLSAAAFVRATPDRMFLSARFWVPRVTAERYESKLGIPYREWAARGWIELIDEPTIGKQARKRIAQTIIAAGPIEAVCYDRYKVEETIAILEAASIPCVPMAQGYSVSPGCFELHRRLLEGSLVIARNGVLRWNAENAETHSDDRGNIWLRKPGATDSRNQGKRHLKIDGLAAAVTALTQARKHSWPKPQITYNFGLAG